MSTSAPPPLPGARIDDLPRAPARGTGAGRFALALLLAIALAAAAFWAGRATMAPAATLDAAAAPQPVQVDVTQQRLGRSILLNASVRQPLRPVAANALAGTVTAVSDGPRSQGDVLYRVDQIPVRVVAGDVPFYRDLGPGAEGEDVTQLQNALRDLGYQRSRADGKFGEGTVSAVKAWQKALGMEQTGVVRSGEILAVGQLPATVTLDPAVLATGRRVVGGEMAVSVPAGAPEFVLSVNDAQASMIPDGTAVTVDSQGHRWPAVVAGRTPKDAGPELSLLSPQGGAVCGDACEQLEVGAGLSLFSEVVLVPEVEGPTVPVAAITTGADGRGGVQRVDAAGTATTVPVRVLGVQNGMAVVEGVAVGDRVVLPDAAGQGESADGAGGRSGSPAGSTSDGGGL